VGTVGTGANATPGATPADSAGTSLGLKYQLELLNADDGWNKPG